MLRSLVLIVPLQAILAWSGAWSCGSGAAAPDAGANQAGVVSSGSSSPTPPSTGGVSSNNSGSCTSQNGVCAATSQCCSGLSCTQVAGASGTYCEDPWTTPCGLNTTICPLSDGGTSCVVTRTDPANCGGCGLVCPSGQVCTGGACVALTSCPEGLLACGLPVSCVDILTNSTYCSNNGSCGSTCAAGQGCANGKCVTSVALTSQTGPAYCQGTYHPLTVVQADGGVDCTGNLAQQAFGNGAICSCAAGSTSQQLTTDSYDSLLGRYSTGGTAGDVLINGAYSSSQIFTIGGNLILGSPLSFSSKGDLVAGNLVVNGSLSGGTLTVGLDAGINGIVSGTNTIGGDLFVPSGDSVSPATTAAAIIRGPVNASATPCDCTHPIDIAGIVAYGATHNDNATIGLASNVFMSPGTDLHLDLPCGEYYLTGVSANKAISIGVHGNTVIYFGGDISTNQQFEITLDATAQLSVFVGGSITSSQQTSFGSTEVPAQTRMYVGGTGGINVSNTQTMAGDLYVPNGPLAFSNQLSLYGSLFVNGFSSSQDITVHYDQGLEGAGASCASGAADAGPDAGTQPPTDTEVIQGCNSATPEFTTWTSLEYAATLPPGADISFQVQVANQVGSFTTGSPPVLGTWTGTASQCPSPLTFVGCGTGGPLPPGTYMQVTATPSAAAGAWPAYGPISCPDGGIESATGWFCVTSSCPPGN